MKDSLNKTRSAGPDAAIASFVVLFKPKRV